jgi:hypothetical protein
MDPDQTIRRGKIGGNTKLQGQAGSNGGPAGGWEEFLRITDVTAGSPVTREGGQANADTHTIFSAFALDPQTLVDSLPPPRVHLRIEVGDGNDSGSAREVYRVLAGAPVTVSGSFVAVSAQIFLDELGLVQAPASITGKVEAFVSIGGGEDIQPTMWPRNLPDTGVAAPPLGAQQQVTIGPGRLRSVQGYSTSATDTFLMFFDWPGPNVLPPNGTLPLFTIKIPAGATFSDDYIESARVVSWGLFWAASSTGDTLTFDGTQTLRVDPEMYSQDLLQGSV